MSSITFKGVSSDTITGLLISEQPDITRPPRRTNSIEVDGRDGDIPEFLGYESYKKRLEIGLFGGYDIDEVANFFSGEGWVIFGNEPTKKYYARIDDEINFERLMRFRKAKVDFVVQPYKKLVTESNVTGATSPLVVNNAGYATSQPVMVLEGTADDVIVLSLNAITIATITIPAEGEITLDSQALNAFNDAGDKNQYVVGVFAELVAGDNDISWTGTLSAMTISPNSRYL